MAANVKSRFARGAPVAVFLGFGLLATCAGGLVVGCSGRGDQQMQWARAALERNSRLEVLAADTNARTFTVRFRDTGVVQVIGLDRLVAGPSPSTGVTSGAGGSVAPAGSTLDGSVSSDPVPAASSNDSEASTSAPQSGANGAAAGITHPSADANSAAASAPTGSGGAGGTTSSPPAVPSVAGAGSVLAAGPGYSIRASGPAGSAQAGGTSVRGTAIERLHEPIICQGARLLHIDNRNLEFDGDAIAAESGCEIHITNSRIIAHGIGVVARAASVHIENSDIEGGTGAIDATSGAQVYAEASRFKGLNRRAEGAAIHDLGGNVWN